MSHFSYVIILFIDESCTKGKKAGRQACNDEHWT